MYMYVYRIEYCDLTNDIVNVKNRLISLSYIYIYIYIYTYIYVIIYIYICSNVCLYKYPFLGFANLLIIIIVRIRPNINSTISPAIIPEILTL